MGRPAIKARKMTNLHSRQSRTTYQFTKLQQQTGFSKTGDQGAQHMRNASQYNTAQVI